MPRFTRESFTKEEFKHLEKLCKSIRGVEFVFKSSRTSIFDSGIFNAYVAAADPLIGITIKPSEPDEFYKNLPVNRQYLCCLSTQDCYSKSRILEHFNQWAKVLRGATPDIMLTFRDITDSSLGGNGSCPFA